jgi:hypothetical protein
MCKKHDTETLLTDKNEYTNNRSYPCRPYLIVVILCRASGKSMSVNKVELKYE